MSFTFSFRNGTRTRTERVCKERGKGRMKSVWSDERERTSIAEEWISGTNCQETGSLRIGHIGVQREETKQVTLDGFSRMTYGEDGDCGS